jgi:hypothetical protein
VQALKENDTPFRIAAENVAIEGIKKMVTDDLGIGFVRDVHTERSRKRLPYSVDG